MDHPNQRTGSAGIAFPLDVEGGCSAPQPECCHHTPNTPSALGPYLPAIRYLLRTNVLLHEVTWHPTLTINHSVDVLDLPGVIVTDRNAASGWVSFLPPVEGLEAINREQLFARSWKHPEDMYEEMSHKSES